MGDLQVDPASAVRGGVRAAGVVALVLVALFLIFVMGIFPTGGKVLVDGAIAPDGTQFVLTATPSMGDLWMVAFDAKRRGERWQEYLLDGDDIYWNGSLSIDRANHIVRIRNYDITVADFDWEAGRFTMYEAGHLEPRGIPLDSPFGTR
jgi:hypothetical protein